MPEERVGYQLGEQELKKLAMKSAGSQELDHFGPTSQGKGY